VDVIEPRDHLLSRDPQHALGVSRRLQYMARRHCGREWHRRNRQDNLKSRIDLSQELDNTPNVVTRFRNIEIVEMKSAWIVGACAPAARADGINGAVPPAAPSLRQAERENENVRLFEQQPHGGQMIVNVRFQFGLRRKTVWKNARAQQIEVMAAAVVPDLVNWPNPAKSPLDELKELQRRVNVAVSGGEYAVAISFGEVGWQ
jgi:hypothetical protein